MKRKSLKQQLSVRLFGMGLVVLALTTALCALVFYRAFSLQAWSDLKLAAQQCAAGYSILEAPAEGLSVFATPQLRLTLIDADGTVLYDSAAAIEENHLSRPEIQQALETGEGQSQRQSATLGYRTCYYALRLPDGRVLRVAQDTESVWGIFLDSLPAVLLIGLAILGLSVALSALFARGLLQPLHEMTGHLDDIQEYVPYDELQPLADTIHADRLLRESNDKLRQDFTANVSHELKTPLTSISGYAELIEGEIARPADVPAFAQRIRKESARMLELVNDILTLSRLDSLGHTENAETPDFTGLDLGEVARGCHERLRVNAQRAFVSFYLDARPALVQGDRGMLDQLCQNLCDNAIRYNRPGGKVILSTGCDAAGVPFLRVKDDGIGIPKEAQSRVFERFYRVDKSRSKATGGTGLGLAIVKHIALVHGAKLELESQLDAGTCITVRFVGKTEN